MAHRHLPGTDLLHLYLTVSALIATMSQGRSGTRHKIVGDSVGIAGQKDFGDSKLSRKGLVSESVYKRGCHAEGSWHTRWRSCQETSLVEARAEGTVGIHTTLG